MLTDGYHRTRYKLAIGLAEVGAILTTASNHPRIVVREGSNGPERGFKLKHHEKHPAAPLSPYFLNLRTRNNPQPGPLTDEIVTLAAYCMNCIQVDQNLVFDAIAPVPRAGDAFADDFSRFTQKPLIMLDKWEHNGKRKIASLKGKVSPEVKKVLLLDDLITEANSKREAIDVLGDVGIQVSDVMVIVDRQEGGREELLEWDCNLHAVFTVTDLFDFYVDTGTMEPKLRHDLSTYLDSRAHA